MNEEVRAKIEALQYELAKEEALNRLQKAADHFETYGYTVSISITQTDTETEENK